MYKVGLYIRLSKEDENEGASESIKNQKSLLLQYVKENNLSIYDIYIDDGYSGTNFNRPAFIRMLNDIEQKKINLVITKDLSRLGRDYIETGNFIEKYFPSHNIRYIAVTDDIDTYLDSSSNDLAPFKAIMNDMYAKDISKKIKSSLRAKMKAGKFVGCRAPFGYDKDPNNKNHLVINEEQALVVKRIFDMSLNGLSYYKIAKILTEDGVKTPSEYYNFCFNNNVYYKGWNTKTIMDILQNRMYTGSLVQNKRSKINYKIKKIVKNNPKDYIIIKNTHEAIIDCELFDDIQKRLPKNIGRCEKKEKHMLDGLLYCGDCKGRISVLSRRKKDHNCYTICNYYRTHMKSRLCSTHSNNYDKLESYILEEIKKEILKNIDKNRIKGEVIKKFKNLNNNPKDIVMLKKKITQINNNLDNIYIDKLNNIISEEQFKRINHRLCRVLDSLNNNLNSLEKESNTRDNNVLNVEKYVDSFLSIKSFSRQLIVNLIEKIEIYEDKSIDIYVTFA